MALMEGKKAQDWINLVLALCLFVSPWIMGFVVESVPAWNAWIAAAVLGVLAIATLAMFAEWEEWASLIVGLWLIASPWLLGFSTSSNPMWTHVVLGGLVTALAVWAVWDERQHPHAHA
ncbi:MAG TPA: SPW repeat protein [Ensifer sp.]|jgi:hypothetical protein|uniref:SPW repeat protein n=1 Tax=Ensifer sp. TaxID=1872086 RepID=UPI002E15B146|nr:SPW repeat protein [Ensifer sp.]